MVPDDSNSDTLCAAEKKNKFHLSLQNFSHIIQKTNVSSFSILVLHLLLIIYLHDTPDCIAKQTHLNIRKNILILCTDSLVLWFRIYYINIVYCNVHSYLQNGCIKIFFVKIIVLLILSFISSLIFYFVEVINCITYVKLGSLINVNTNIYFI